MLRRTGLSAIMFKSLAVVCLLGTPTTSVAGGDCTPEWSTLGSGVLFGGSIRALVVFDDGSGPALYAGGEFTQSDGSPVSNIARWDGAAWFPLGEGMDGVVWALTVFDDGTGPALYAGGEFTQAGGNTANRVAPWDGVAWSPLGVGFNNEVRTLAVYNDGSGQALYTGGLFTQAGGSPANRVARWGSPCTALPCPADVTGDGSVNLADLNLVLANFGQTTTDGDTNGDGVVDLADLNAVLAAFGQVCP